MYIHNLFSGKNTLPYWKNRDEGSDTAVLELQISSLLQI